MATPTTSSPRFHLAGGAWHGAGKEIDPSEIHKAKPENVWIHHPVQESPHSLSARFEIPVGTGAPRFVDLVEVQRQVGILQAHRQLGVPDGDVFTLDQIALTLVSRASPSDVPRRWGSVRAQIVATSARGRARSLAQHFALEGPSGLIAIGKARASLIPRRVYERVREQARSLPAPATLPLHPEFAIEQPLRVDVTDALLSDHPSDHFTAMQTIADIERVAKEMVANTNLRSLKLKFQRYADADPSPILRLRVSAKGRLAAEVVQLGARCAKVSGTLDSVEDCS